MRLAYVFAGATVARVLFMWFAWRAQLRPDAGFYVDSGVGLFPSPLGSLAGAFLGWTGLAILNALAAGACVLLVALLADRLGFRVGLAAGVCALSPVFIFWTGFLGVDALAAALVLGAVYLRLSGRTLAAGVVILAAVLVHYAIAPAVLAALLWELRHRRLLALGLVTLSLAALAYVASRTLFAPALAAVWHPTPLIVWGGATLVLALAPFVPFLGRIAAVDAAPLRPYLVALALGVIAAAGGMAAVGDHDTGVRYALPLTALAAVAVAHRRELAALERTPFALRRSELAGEGRA